MHQLKCCSSVSEIEEGLNAKFKAIAQIPLFQDKEIYKASLPVRDIGNEFVKLYTLPYFAHQSDVMLMARELEKPSNERGSRTLIKYACAPSASGKTASILPAFLKSEKFKRYLYIPFDNNNRRQFKYQGTVSDKDEHAINQGAAFAHECVRRLLMEPQAARYSIPDEAKVPSEDESISNLTDLLSSLQCEPEDVLIHVDEHKKMFETENGKGHLFRRGALQALAQTNATVIATYIRPPDYIDTAESSGVCRWAVFIPQPHVTPVLKHMGIQLPAMPVLDKDADQDSKHQLALFKRQRAVFQVRFGLCLELKRTVIHKPDTSDFMKNIVDNLQHTLRNDGEPTDLLKKCTRICDPMEMIETLEHVTTPHAAKLLVGVPDNENVARLDDLVVLENNKLSSPISKLLNFSDEDKELNVIYQEGRKRFLNCLNGVDLLHSSPLEEAYLWVIACESALQGFLRFGSQKFNIRCSAIKAGRIFPKDDNDFKFKNVNDLEHNVIYYANEPGRNGDSNHTHPRADMWFRTAEDELVLIDITD